MLVYAFGGGGTKTIYKKKEIRVLIFNDFWSYYTIGEIFAKKLF
jgi:hypothetical protein